MGITHLLRAIIATPFILLIPGYVTLAAFEGQRENQGPSTGLRAGHDGLEVIFGWVLTSVLITSVCALLLAELGRFSLMGTLLLVTGYSVALILVRRPRLDPVERWRELKWDRSQVLALGLLLIAAVLFFRPFENVFGGRDGGVYVNTGIHIARTGAILVHDDFFAQFPRKVQEELVWVFPGTENTGITFKYPGFYWVQDGSLLVPQFFHLYPVWIGIFYAAFGLVGALFVTPLFGWLGAIGLYLVGKTLFRPEVGLAALALMSVNASQVWFSRYANADIFFQLLFLGGLLYWVRFVRQGHGIWGVLAGACFGEALLAKLDAEFLLIPLVLVLGYLCLLAPPASPPKPALSRVEGLGGKEGGRKLWYFVVPFAALAGLSAVHIRLFAWPYYAMLLGLAGSSFLSKVLVSSVFLLAFFAIALILSKMEVTKVSILLRLLNPRRAIEIVSAYRRPISLAAAACIIAAGFYMYFILPGGFDRLSGIDRVLAGPYDEPRRNFVELGWYLTPLGLFLAVIGAAQITVERWDRETILFLLSAFVFSLVDLRFFSMAWSDHIWAIRRHISVVIPSATLFIAYAIVRLGQALRGNRISRTLPIVMVAILMARLIQINWPIIINQEFAGAIAQAQELAEALPERAVVIFDASWVGNFLAPPLAFIHDKETVAFWPEEGEGPFELESVEAVATTGFAEGREVFFISTHEILPFSASYDLYPIRAATLKAPQLEHALDHFPQKIERWELPYRVYNLRPAVGSMGYEYEDPTYP